MDRKVNITKIHHESNHNLDHEFDLNFDHKCDLDTQGNLSGCPWHYPIKKTSGVHGSKIDLIEENHRFHEPKVDPIEKKHGVHGPKVDLIEKSHGFHGPKVDLIEKNNCLHGQKIDPIAQAWFSWAQSRSDREKTWFYTIPRWILGLDLIDNYYGVHDPRVDLIDNYHGLHGPRVL